MIDNFLLPEQLIVERLRQYVPVARDVVSRLPVEDVINEGLTGIRMPAVLVVYDGHSPVQQKPQNQNSTTPGTRRGKVELQQRWITVAVTQNVRTSRSEQAARDEIGEIMLQTTRVLLGWRPANGFTPLVMAETQAITRHIDGFTFYPLLWTTNTVVLGDLPEE